jgi:hypothetical protein
MLKKTPRGITDDDRELMSLKNRNLYQVTCGVRGDTGPGCNAVGVIDRQILGIQHLYGRPVYARSQVLF